MVKKLFFTAAVLALVLGTFAGCRGGSATQAKEDESIKDLVYPIVQSRELETFNILQSQRAEDSENLTNLVDGFLETDPWGTLLPALATDWGTDDSITWTFNLRHGVKWVDVNGNPKADVTAWDWATALEWILNFYKNDSNNTSMPSELIAGAADYYNWTKSLSEDEALALKAGSGSRFLETVGIAIPDDYTVVYTCLAPKPFFVTLALYQALYPMSQGMVDELGGPVGVKAMNNMNMWYNGAYTMTSYIHANEKVFTKNPLYWDTVSSRFDTVTIKMVDSADVSYQLYQSGEVDYTGLSESNTKTISNNPDNKFHDYIIPGILSLYSYQYHWNYDKKKQDGTPDTNWNTAIANLAFRKAIAAGLDLTTSFRMTNPITPMLMENNFFTMKGLVQLSDGTEYTELVRQEMGLPPLNGQTPVRLDAAKAAQYKAQAIEELTALGVTFPVVADHFIAGANQTSLDAAQVLKSAFSEGLGDDFIVLNINTYVNSISSEVIRPSLQSFALNGWGADYGDPANFLGQVTYGDDNASYSANYSNINRITTETDANRDLLNRYREFTRMVKAADGIIVDMDERFRAFAKAEAYFLDNVLTLPDQYSQGNVLGKVDTTSRMRSLYGIQDFKLKNWRTNVNGYTTAEAQALREIHAQGRK
jgi:oligopeptide transport system substrate-binding protein